jgi:hypothetical protein
MEYEAGRKVTLDNRLMPPGTKVVPGRGQIIRLITEQTLNLSEHRNASSPDNRRNELVLSRRVIVAVR